MENVNPGTDGMHTVPNGGGSGDDHGQDVDESLLPLTNLTATSLLGGHAPGHETINQLYARQIASAIAMKTPHERRLLVLGLGLDRSEPDRDSFFAVVDLVLQCI
jgi:proteasome assembly chaperone 3